MKVVDGTWTPGALLSLKVGSTHHHVPLQSNTCVSFPGQMKGPMQVGVYSCVGNADLDADVGFHKVCTDGHDFKNIVLAVTRSDDAVPTPRRELQKALATDEYIRQHDLSSFALDVASPRLMDGVTSASTTPGPQHQDVLSEATTDVEERQEVRDDAKEYIERFELRHVLQEMFQQLIRQKPEDPFCFMQSYFVDGSARRNMAASASQKVDPSSSKATLHFSEVAVDHTGSGPAKAAAVKFPAKTLAFPQLAMTSSGTCPVPAAAAPKTLPTVPEVDAQMLTRLMANTTRLSPPDTQENGSSGTDPETPLVAPSELIVDIANSKDNRSNGPYALAGTCNCRPFYRLLGPSKRYLFFAHGANAWTGWWVAESLGSEEYVDRFVDASGSSAPSSCTGVLGSRLTPGTPTPEVFQNISLVSDHYEKVAIRSKFAEVLGDQVASLEQRAPHQPGIVGVARVLEAHQRALQLLHGQLSTETKRRLAAEEQAHLMEDAFEALQLRLSMTLPSVVPQKGEADKSELQRTRTRSDARP